LNTGLCRRLRVRLVRFSFYTPDLANRRLGELVAVAAPANTDVGDADFVEGS